MAQDISVGKEADATVVDAVTQEDNGEASQAIMEDDAPQQQAQAQAQAQAQGQQEQAVDAQLQEEVQEEQKDEQAIIPKILDYRLQGIYFEVCLSVIYMF